jgi:hypothetical protein
MKIIVLSIALAALLAACEPMPPEQARARDTIEYCKKEMDRRSLSPDVARMVAKACEEREDKYVKDYGRRP